MKKYGTLITLVLAVFCGLAAVLLFSKWQAGRATQPALVKNDMPNIGIVIAARDIDIGTRLSAETLAMAQWPKANIPKGAFEDLAALDGRVAVTKLVAGEPVLAAELAAPGSGAGLVAIIPNGMRAMAVRVDEVIGVAGFILPNTFVDVIGVETDNGGIKTAKTLLKKIQVLAIAQETFTEEGKAKIVKTVTMQVTPEEAEKLALQTYKGDIRLSLRNPLEGEKPVEVASAPVRRQMAAKPKARPHEVEIIRADKRESVHFQGSNSEARLPM